MGVTTTTVGGCGACAGHHHASTLFRPLHLLKLRNTFHSLSRLQCRPPSRGSPVMTASWAEAADATSIRVVVDSTGCRRCLRAEIPPVASLLISPRLASCRLTANKRRYAVLSGRQRGGGHRGEGSTNRHYRRTWQHLLTLLFPCSYAPRINTAPHAPLHPLHAARVPYRYSENQFLSA